MKTAVKTMLWLLALVVGLGFSVQGIRAEDDNDDPAEEVLFSESVSPDALLLVDLSGSMQWNPPGTAYKYGASAACKADTSTTSKCSGSNCSGGFCSVSKTGCSTDCSRLNIAKKAIFSLFDYNGDGTIDVDDREALNIRFGYMRFYDCSGEDSSVSYSSGCNKIHFELGGSTDTGIPYSQIYCRKSEEKGKGCKVGSTCTTGVCVNRESALGGTPLVSALKEAKAYLDYHKNNKDPGAKECRKKYVILISDGADTYACSGNGQECQATSYKRRRESVLAAKALKDAGYRLFVIGLGDDMPSYLKNTLNWMAYYGGTDNTKEPNEINPDQNLNLAGLSGCKTEPSSNLEDARCYSDSSSSGTMLKWMAKQNDPGYCGISGYAFMAANEEDLSAALRAAVNEIVSAIYSFSQASIQASRTEDENFLYEGSFEPSDDDPFWKGHLRQFPILFDGTIGPESWDAGVKLAETAAGDRKIYTYKGGAMTKFKTTHITPGDLGITTGTDPQKVQRRDAIVGFVRGESAYNKEEVFIGSTAYTYKLGDVFRTTPITIGTPSPYYDDNRDTAGAFATHRTEHQRTTTKKNRVVTVGTNNGQFHAFHTHNGTEAWSFIPPNLMPKFQLIAHDSHPTALVHHYFIDGPLSGADVWWGGSGADGTLKDPGEWRTILVFGEGRGSVNYAWSSSPHCDADLNPGYTATHKYYCGYHALDVTNSPSVPTYLWNMNFDDATRAAQAPYIGDPWSKMQLGRIRVSEGGMDVEKWVGFVGGGYNPNTGTSDGRGKGFFVVDLKDGRVLWSFTLGSSTSMKYSFPAGPAIIDTDNDGFIDTAYIGDLGGNIWRFRFCRRADMDSDAPCGISDWSGNLFFDASTGAKQPIYTTPSATRDAKGRLWLYWGTGDKVNPTAPSQDHFYGVKDLDRNTTYKTEDLTRMNALGQTFDPGSSSVGYRIALPGDGEKVLSDPTLYGGVVYFTTYLPPDPGNLCMQAGSAYIYGIKYTTGGCALGESCRKFLGVGIPSSPIISAGPGGKAGIYATVSGGAGIGGETFRVPHDPGGRANQTNIIYWKDRRID